MRCSSVRATFSKCVAANIFYQRAPNDVDIVFADRELHPDFLIASRDVLRSKAFASARASGWYFMR